MVSTHKSYSDTMKRFIFFSIFSIIFAKDPLTIEEFVDRYFLVSKSKMESSATAWQDLREGYMRNYGIYFSEIVLDSLDINAISPYEAGIRHFKTMDKIREEVYSGKEYELVFEKKTRPNFNVNYFSSNID